MLKKSARVGIGLTLMAIGLLGLVLPLIPGIILLFIGLEIAGLSFLFPKKIKKIRDKVKEKIARNTRDDDENNKM